MTNSARTGPASAAASGQAPPAPAWAVRAAHAVPLVVLPSGLWRVAMAVGVPVGYSTEVLRADYDAPGWGSLYIIGLSVVAELLALLTLGLVRAWGEVAPAWLPLIGGRRLDPRAVVYVAGTGATLLTLLMTSQLVVALLGLGQQKISATGETVMYLFYAPLLLWGPLLAAVTYSYRRRHRG